MTGDKIGTSAPAAGRDARTAEAREPALAGTHGATATAPATARLANANFTGDLMDLRSAQRHAGHGATGLVADRAKHKAAHKREQGSLTGSLTGSFQC
jgi:hypothetical protein